MKKKPFPMRDRCGGMEEEFTVSIRYYGSEFELPWLVKKEQAKRDHIGFCAGSRNDMYATKDEAITEALRFIELGELSAARECIREALVRYPTHDQALKLLAVLPFFDKQRNTVGDEDK